MRKEPKERGGFRLDLGEPWKSDLTDFCAANYGSSKTEVIREALEEHIERCLTSPACEQGSIEPGGAVLAASKGSEDRVRRVREWADR